MHRCFDNRIIPLQRLVPPPLPEPPRPGPTGPTLALALSANDTGEPEPQAPNEPRRQAPNEPDPSTSFCTNEPTPALSASFCTIEPGRASTTGRTNEPERPGLLNRHERWQLEALARMSLAHVASKFAPGSASRGGQAG